MKEILKLALPTAWISLCSLLPSQAIYDDFDDGDRDGPQWSFPESIEQMFTESGSLLMVDGPPNQIHANMTSTQIFRGDFEFHMDWRDFSSTASSFALNPPGFGIDIQSINTNEFVSISRSKDQTGEVISTVIAVNGSSNQGSTTSTTQSAGLFKVVRAGTVMETWYDVGAGWILQDSITNAFTNDVRIQLSSYSGDNGIFHAATDWIKFSGTEVLPSVDIKLNGSDSPVTLQSGDRAVLSISMDTNLLTSHKGDWFVYALTSFGDFWLDDNGKWILSSTPIPCRTGPFLDFSYYPIFDTSNLPSGQYEFFFDVDPFGNGNYDDGQGMRWDVVHLNVQ